MSVLDTKNLSPRLLALITATVVSLANALLCILFHLPWYLVIFISCTTFIITGWLYHFTLQRFIYRKIKLIYKFIYQTKATRREEFFYDNVLPRKSINDVSRDVQQWAGQRKAEMQRLRETEQFRKDFLMNLAHELRTPIFTIQGYVDTLLDGALEDENVNRKFLTNASRSINRLAELTSDLDEISKLESGRSELEPSPFNIHELIRNVFDEFSLQADEKQITLRFKKGTERTVGVLADKPKIRQVLANLTENALKYSGSGGEVTAGIYHVDDHHIYVEISDNGPGIAEEHLPRIFERFYRADRSRNRNIGGTGLGLAIVKHIVEAHGQTVTARSKPGVGSSFGFTLESKG